MRDGATRIAADDARRRLADAHESGHHHRIRRQCTAGWVDPYGVVEPERFPQNDFLMRERRMQLGDIDAATADARLLASERGRW